MIYAFNLLRLSEAYMSVQYRDTNIASDKDLLPFWHQAII